MSDCLNLLMAAFPHSLSLSFLAESNDKGNCHSMRGATMRKNVILKHKISASWDKAFSLFFLIVFFFFSLFRWLQLMKDCFYSRFLSIYSWNEQKVINTRIYHIGSWDSNDSQNLNFEFSIKLDWFKIALQKLIMISRRACSLKRIFSWQSLESSRILFPFTI